MATSSESPLMAQPFQVRIVSLDYYMSRPNPRMDERYSEFAGAGIDRVPVIRMFGATPAGQAVCLHLHKVGYSLYYVCLHGACSIV